MAPSQTNPRRRPLKGPPPQVPHLKTTSLRKTGTFHSPTLSSPDIIDPVDHAVFMPKRSSTSPEALAELVNDAAINRITNILERFDATLSGKSSPSTTTNLLHDPEVYPVPSFLLDRTTMDTEPMDVDQKIPSGDHASDSGLGSSIDEPKHDHAAPSGCSVASTFSKSHSAITKSVSALGCKADEPKHVLGEYAYKVIRDKIIEPILAEESLKDFHPLIQDVPRRIGSKYINNLRDLEKTLIFLAPEFSATSSSYLRFCERSVQLLYATVHSLPERDQRLPTDRPYTNHYFLDLVEQIRRYATIMAATRQKQEDGEELDEMDYSPDEKITLRGGLSHDGTPVELVREKNGKVIPLAEQPSEIHASKRGLEGDLDDDGARRSMARRRKSGKPSDVMHLCKSCDKQFDRACDLTKHEKTHSRPWKCPELNCKYHDLGWPTEKERDRHVNDRHSSAPAQHKCQFPPCTYVSKRESNCKQHMEKAHNWTYIRSKSNGRKKAVRSSNQSPQTPLTPLINTPASTLQKFPTPMTPFAPSPAVPSYRDFDLYTLTPALSTEAFEADYRRDSVTTAGSVMSYSSGFSPYQPAAFENTMTPEIGRAHHDAIFDQTTSCQGTPFTTGIGQQPTPALSGGFDSFPNFGQTYTFDNFEPSTTATHLSLGGQADATLLSNTESFQLDEGFEDGFSNFNSPMGDFTLFDTHGQHGQNLDIGDTWFEDLPNLGSLGSQFDNIYTSTMGGQFGENSKL